MINYEIETRCPRCGRLVSKEKKHVCGRINGASLKTVAEQLTICGNRYCSNCKYKGLENCRERLIFDMGEEVKRIAEESEDDGK